MLGSADGKLRFPRLPPQPGVYCLHFEAMTSGHRHRIYVGESDNLRRRASNYRNPSPTQKTSRRVSELLRAHLGAGGSVRLVIATDANLTDENGSRSPLDLSRKTARLLIENAVLVVEE